MIRGEQDRFYFVKVKTEEARIAVNDNEVILGPFRLDIPALQVALGVIEANPDCRVMLVDGIGADAACLFDCSDLQRIVAFSSINPSGADRVG